jgi:hypothetical protein
VLGKDANYYYRDREKTGDPTDQKRAA